MILIPGETYKVLSVCQPWAELLVLGIKKIETRSWYSAYTGELLIHASKKPMDQAGEELAFLYNLQKLAYGAIIGQVHMDKAFYMCAHDVAANQTYNPTEYELGHWEEGRFGWKMSNPRKFITTIPTKGQLRIWNYRVA